MNLKARITCVLVFLLVLHGSSVGQAVKPSEKVANVEYDTNVTQLRDKLAKTFPLMALVEVRIIEVLLDAAADLGFLYNFVGHDGRLNDSNLDLRVLSSHDPGLRMKGILKDTSESELNAAIETLATQRKVSIWAEPSILTLMGRKAAIQSGDEVPYIKRVVVGNTVTISSDFRATGVSMWVLPNTVEHNGERFVTLELYANVSTVTRFRQEEGYQQPITDTREYQSTVELRSGQYVVLGGIYRSVVSENQRGIPGFMSVPIVGWAGRGTSGRSNQSELLILVRPQIVNLERTQSLNLQTMANESRTKRHFLLNQKTTRKDLLQNSLGPGAGGKQ